MRQVDPLCLHAWADCRKPLRMLLLKAAGLPEGLADIRAEMMPAEQVIAIATAAARLMWQAETLMAMAPVAVESLKKPGRPAQPFPTLNA